MSQTVDQWAEQPVKVCPDVKKRPMVIKQTDGQFFTSESNCMILALTRLMPLIVKKGIS